MLLLDWISRLLTFVTNDQNRHKMCLKVIKKYILIETKVFDNLKLAFINKYFGSELFTLVGENVVLWSNFENTCFRHKWLKYTKMSPKVTQMLIFYRNQGFWCFLLIKKYVRSVLFTLIGEYCSVTEFRHCLFSPQKIKICQKLYTNTLCRGSGVTCDHGSEHITYMIVVLR